MHQPTVLIFQLTGLMADFFTSILIYLFDLYTISLNFTISEKRSLIEIKVKKCG